MTDKQALRELADRVEGLDGPSLELEVLSEVALFKPHGRWVSCRANSALTKVVYTDSEGEEDVCWPDDWTDCYRREGTVAALRALGDE